MGNTPLTVLDLVPVPSGSTAADALRNSTDLARQAERLGYARYWVAEHHLNPGVAGTSPAVVLALIAPATSTIRLGSGALQLGHRTALSVLEEFGLIEALYPGRLDLGLGRSAGLPAGRPQHPVPAGASVAGSAAPATGRNPATGGNPATAAAGGGVPNRLTIPPRRPAERLRDQPRLTSQKKLLHQPGAEPGDYAEQIGDILALLRGTYRLADGRAADVVPGAGADLQVWILGSSGGQSALVAGANGLRFAANYHVSPSTVLEAVAAYRDAFRPSGDLDRPYVSVSADVVVAEDEATARELATGYGLWVRSIRAGQGAIEFPTPEEARAHPWSDTDRELVADRVDTQFVGSPRQVARQLETLRDATGADELIVTTSTHDHADRVRSYDLLAQEWHGGAHRGRGRRAQPRA